LDVAGATSRNAIDPYAWDDPSSLRDLLSRSVSRERSGRPITAVHHLRRFEGVVERRFGEDIQRGIGRVEAFD